MAGGPSHTTTTQNANLPPEAAALVKVGGEQTQAGLGNAPITDFQNPNVQQIAGADPATYQALAYYQSLLNGGATPGILGAFNQLQLPLLQQQAMLAGQGRGDALTKALAQGQATALMPALQIQSNAAGSVAGLGDYLRQIGQQKNDAPYNDFLRRQGITESLLSGATGLIPSSIGSRGATNVNNSGLLGALFGYNAK